MNKPGSDVEDLKGGVAGGSILKGNLTYSVNLFSLPQITIRHYVMNTEYINYFIGVLKVGQEIEVRPGLVSKDSEGKLTCKPIRSKIVSLFAEQNDLMYAVPGGLIGVGTKVSQKRNICKH